jgi:hypothetical protein
VRRARGLFAAQTAFARGADRDKVWRSRRPIRGAKHEAENDMANREQRKNREKKKPKKDKDKPKSGNPNTPFSSGQDAQKNKK